MDIFRDLKNKNFDYSSKINTNKYTQSENTISTKKDKSKSDNNFSSIYELILSIKDPKYNILEEKEKDTYSKEEKLKLCSLIDSEYDNYNFNKKVLSKSLICSNLQKLKDNYLSLVLFYNEYFKINLVIFRQNNYYRTGLKNYDNVYITFNKGKWSILTNLNENIVFSSVLSELNTIIDYDIKSNFIYNQYLKAISNYKLDQLVDIAKELNIELKNNNKKKTKKELYEEINFTKL